MGALIKHLQASGLGKPLMGTDAISFIRDERYVLELWFIKRENLAVYLQHDWHQLRELNSHELIAFDALVTDALNTLGTGKLTHAHENHARNVFQDPSVTWLYSGSGLIFHADHTTLTFEFLCQHDDTKDVVIMLNVYYNDDWYRVERVTYDELISLRCIILEMLGEKK